jgi:hypothetical protein
MADEKVPERDPFDLGNIDKPREVPAAQAAAASPPVTPADDRPRNPDGTFKKAPNHPAFLVESAKHYGFSDEEIAETPTEKLYPLVVRMHRVAETSRAQAATERTAERQAVVTPPPPEPEEDEEALIEKLVEEEGMSDRAARILRKLSKRTKSLDEGVSKVREQVGKIDEREMIRSRAQSNAMVDQAIAKLDPKLKPFFGEGGYYDLPEDSFERQRRLMVAQNAGLLVDERGVIVEAQGAVNAKIARAAMLFMAGASPDAKPPVKDQESILAPKPAANGNGRITQEQWDEQALPAGGRRSVEDETPGDALAIKNLRKKMMAKEAGDSKSPSQELKDLGLL